MGNVPLVRRKNALAAAAKNGACQFSALLPEMQTREHYKRPELQGGKNLIINHQPDAKTQC